VRGRVINMPPPGIPHGGIQADLASRLIGFVKSRRLGKVVVGSGVILERDPDTVRAPDISVFLQGDGESTSLPDGYAERMPELAVEIVSPSDRRPMVRRKAESYIAAGVALVWLIDPRDRTVRVYAAGVEPRDLRADDVLDGGDVVPGFSLPVADIFAL
ncbi:MAG: Uma2 family endonuclease, partial [Ardenticatenales bacterium]